MHALFSHASCFAENTWKYIYYDNVREKVLQEEIKIEKIDTDDQVAYIFTKGLSGCKFEIFLIKLGILQGRSRNSVLTGVEIQAQHIKEECRELLCCEQLIKGYIGSKRNKRIRLL